MKVKGCGRRVSSWAKRDARLLVTRGTHCVHAMPSTCRDWKTGDSLNYGFIGFDSEDACEQAFFKMNNVLIDDRRIKVDFSQSVSHLWKQFKRFGRKGNADLGAEAETHQRQQGAPGEAGRLRTASGAACCLRPLVPSAAQDHLHLVLS